jgi:dTDP-4-dehydrorhamnose 3,5-epimerase
MSDTDFIKSTEIDGVFVIERPTFGDERGFFRETFRQNDLEARLGYKFNVVQANHSRSIKGGLRGIHIAPWNKLVTVTRGEVQQIVVDTRPDSPTFGKYLSWQIGDSNRISIFIPAGCGNAFLVLSDDADYNYLTTDYWAAGKEKMVIYNDPDLGIDWQLDTPVVSEKDLANSPLRQVFPEKFSQ